MNLLNTITKKNFFLIIALILSVGFVSAAGKPPKPITIRNAVLLNNETIQIYFAGLPQDLKGIKFEVTPKVSLGTPVRKGTYLDFPISVPLTMGTEYTFTVKRGKEVVSAVIDTDLLFQQSLDKIYSDKPLGHIIENGKNIFRYFVPRGKSVSLIIFDKYDDKDGTRYEMKNDGSQVFECEIDGDLTGKYYGYQITERNYDYEAKKPLIDDDIVVADPYGKALVQSCDFPQKGRTLIMPDTKFDWQGTTFAGLDIADAVIMESHVKDLTAHATAKSANPGTYKGIINAKVGGLAYLKSLGVNAVEFLPIQDFCNVEVPYRQVIRNDKGIAYYNTNSWNPYSQNYWGYMTSNYFCPESYYAADGSIQSGKWSGTKGAAVTELKELVRELHKNGIAVIMDVVYNHVSENDENALKYTDFEFYFKREEHTGCGNEVESRRPMVRRMIIDSIKYWISEYHIDGFRFDLAGCIDYDTLVGIRTESQKINPKAMIIAEPWTAGGKATSTKNDMIKAGWSYWNDGIRGAIRGDNRPNKPQKSFMMGDNDAAGKIADYWKGTSGGQSYQSVNYIESHDDSTLGDNIRYSSGEYKALKDDGSFNRITDLAKYTKLSPRLLASSKVGAAALFLCQGPIMMHLGQEWARGKVTPDLTGKVQELTTKGEVGKASDNVIFNMPTPNSYSADNETNYINYDLAAVNKDLTDYYRGLIALRKQQPLLGSAKPDQITIIKEESNKNALGVVIDNKIVGLVNSSPTTEATFVIPDGQYDIVVNDKSAGTKSLGTVSGGNVTVPTASSLILIKK